MENLNIGGHSIAYLDQGQGPTVMFVHGFPLDHSMWRFQVDALKKEYRVICPDLPGFGNSSLSKTNLSLRDYADVLAGMLQALEIDKVTFCGLSMGGYIGWQFLRYHGQLLYRLVASNTRAGDDSEKIVRGRKLMAQIVHAKGSRFVSEQMLPKLFNRSVLGSQAALVESVGETIAATNPDTVSMCQLAMAGRPDATSWLPEIKVPTLFIVGEDDEITTPQEMRSNAASVPDSRFEIIEKTAHLSPLENPKRFNEVLTSFLAED